jgi:hypothetical protein
MRACPGAGWCPYHLHLVPPPGAHKNLPPRAREAPTLILSSSQPAPFSAPSFSMPSQSAVLELTFWSERAIGQATLSVSRDLSQKAASALSLSLEFSFLAARPGRQLKNSYFPTPKFMLGFLHHESEIGMFQTLHWDFHDNSAPTPPQWPPT